MTRSNRLRGCALRLFGAGMLALALGGCGDQNLFESLADDDTSAAQIEAAKIAIDDGNFTEAISILQGLCGTSTSAPACDAETASLLASAFAGRAGMNVFDLIENSVDAAGSTLSTLATFSTLLSSPTSTDKNDLRDALDILTSVSIPTANQSLQMAIYAMADAVVAVGVDLTNGFSDTTGLPTTIPDVPAIQSAEATDQTLTRVAQDLDLAIQGLSGSGLGNEDLRNDIEALEAAIDSNQDGTVSAAEMQSFLQNPS